MNPPPVLNPPPREKTFAHQAASAALLAPALALVVSWTAQVPDRAEAYNRLSAWIPAIVSILFILIGLLMAIFALAGIPRHGKQGLLGRGIAGLLLNGGLMTVMVFSAATAYSRAKHRSEASVAFGEFNSALQELRSDLNSAYDPELGMTNDPEDRIDRFRAAVDSAARTAEGDESRLLRAASAFFAKLQAATLQYRAVAEDTGLASIGDLSTLEEKSQIEERRAGVRRFMAANQDLKLVTLRQEQLLQAELLACDVSSRSAAKLLDSFSRGQARLRPKMVEIRECDDRIGQSLLKILDLAETHWGNWYYDQQEERIVFKNEAATEAFDQAADAITRANGDQIRLQGELINLQNNASAGTN